MSCPKCGTDAGWIGPKYTYVESLRGREYERLEFKCSVCGYTRTEPTKDAPKMAVQLPHTGLKLADRKRKWWEFPL